MLHRRDPATQASRAPEPTTRPAAAATRAGVTAPSNPAAPNRNLIAAVAVATAASASRHAQPKVSGILNVHPRGHRDREEQRPHRLQPPRCAAQPAPHRRRRHPQAHADPARPFPV